MNNSTLTKTYFGRALATTAMVAMFLAGCATTPQSPPGAADVRAKLTRLQSDTDLASRAPIEIREAETAVRLAEIPVPKDQALGAYRVYLADYKVEIAEAKAATRYAEHQRIALNESRERARLHSRTLEADRAQRQADMARDDASRARSDASWARSEADAARASEANASADAARRAELARNEAEWEAERTRNAAAADATRRVELARNEAEREAERTRSASEDARAQASAEAARERAELQRQIDLLQAKPTERGLVLTLGNVLFATGRAELKAGSIDTLNNLVAFLNQYPERNIKIEGHTDNVGTDASNLALSERRAGSVRSYLLQQGVGSQRITYSGLGESRPIANNDTDSGRQQNRRVEIIIDQPLQVTAVTPSGD